MCSASDLHVWPRARRPDLPPSTRAPARSVGHTGVLQSPSTLAWGLNLTRAPLADVLTPVVSGSFTVAANTAGNVSNIVINGSAGVCTLGGGCGSLVSPLAPLMCGFTCPVATAAATVALDVDTTPIFSDEVSPQVGGTDASWREHARGHCCRALAAKGAHARVGSLVIWILFGERRDRPRNHSPCRRFLRMGPTGVLPLQPLSSLR